MYILSGILSETNRSDITAIVSRAGAERSVGQYQLLTTAITNCHSVQPAGEMIEGPIAFNDASKTFFQGITMNCIDV